MLIYKRHIITNILVPFCITSFIIISITWITQLLKLLNLLDKGIGLFDFFQLSILLIPSLLYLTLPIIITISVAYAYNKLRIDRQIIILSSNGINNINLINPAIILCTIITIFAYMNSAYFMPKSYNILKKDIYKIKNNYVAKIITPKTFTQISKKTTIYVKEQNKDGSIAGVVIFDNRVPAEKSVIFAKKGDIKIIDQKPIIYLFDGIRQAYDSSNNITKLRFDSLVLDIGHSESQNLESKKQINNAGMYIQDLLFPTDNTEPYNVKRAIVDGHNRILWPLYNIILPLIVLSILLKTPYSRVVQYKESFLIVLFVILAIVLHFSLEKMSYNNFKIIILSYINVILFALGSLWYSIKTRTRV